MSVFVVITLLLVGSCHCLLDGGQTGELAAMATKIQQLEEEMAALKSAVNDGVGPIAFTAGLSNTLTAIGNHQHIIFDHVYTNLGSAYSPTQGHFTAPVAGAYAFFVVLTNTPSHSSSIRLEKNGDIIGLLLADDAASTSMFVTSTLAVTTHLQQGDEVWVQNEGAFSDVEHIDGGNWSSFSGHLIAKD